MTTHEERIDLMATADDLVERLRRESKSWSEEVGDMPIFDEAVDVLRRVTDAMIELSHAERARELREGVPSTALAWPKLPTEPGLYTAKRGQVWELHDDGTWDEVHGDSAEFNDHPLYRLVPETANTHRDAEIEAEIAAEGLPEGASLDDLIVHHRASAGLVAVLQMMADAGVDVDNRAIASRHSLDYAIRRVLWNAGNYPAGAQPHILGRDIAPLSQKVLESVLEVVREEPEPVSWCAAWKMENGDYSVFHATTREFAEEQVAAMAESKTAKAGIYAPVLLKLVRA